MIKDLRQRYCLVGVGHTQYGKTPGLSQVALNVLAIRAALEDAGLTSADLDGVLTKAPTSTFPMLWAPRIAEALRVEPKVTGTLDQAGASRLIHPNKASRLKSRLSQQIKTAKGA